MFNQILHYYEDRVTHWEGNKAPVDLCRAIILNRTVLIIYSTLLISQAKAEVYTCTRRQLWNNWNTIKTQS